MKKLINRLAACTLSMCVITSLMLTSCAGNARESEEEEETEEAETTVITVSPSEEGSDTDFSPDFTFTASDRDGNVYTEQVFSEHDLTMINFWEPWCGPCVSEMPDLQRLADDYSERGLYILGVYSETTMEDEVTDLLNSQGIKYPILRYTSDFDQFQSGYVPTTIFVDRDGHLITPASGDPLYVGSNTYEDWAAVIEENLP